jgi:hypothetical protein
VIQRGSRKLKTIGIVSKSTNQNTKRDQETEKSQSGSIIDTSDHRK